MNPLTLGELASHLKGSLRFGSLMGLLNPLLFGARSQGQGS